MNESEKSDKHRAAEIEKTFRAYQREHGERVELSNGIRGLVQYIIVIAVVGVPTYTATKYYKKLEKPANTGILTSKRDGIEGRMGNTKKVAKETREATKKAIEEKSAKRGPKKKMSKKKMVSKRKNSKKRTKRKGVKKESVKKINPATKKSKKGPLPLPPNSEQRKQMDPLSQIIPSSLPTLSEIGDQKSESETLVDTALRGI